MTQTYDAGQPPEWIAEAMARKDEPLVPELVAHLFPHDRLGFVLKHPLVFEVPYHPGLAYRCNDMLRHKQAALAEAMADGRWDSYLWLHERPYRPDALTELEPSMVTDAEWWGLVRDCWIDSENPWQWNPADLFGVDRPGRYEGLMNEDERHELEAMPATVTVWRGCTAKNKRGWSWTWDKERAEWFARRQTWGGAQGLVLAAKVDRGQIVAHFLTRGECEIVADPADVRVYRTTKVGPE